MGVGLVPETVEKSWKVLKGLGSILNHLPQRKRSNYFGRESTVSFTSSPTKVGV